MFMCYWRVRSLLLFYLQYVPAAPPTEPAAKLEEKHVFLTYVAPVHYDALTLL